MVRLRNRIILFAIDAFLINFAVIFALFVRFEGHFNDQFIHYFNRYMSAFIIITVMKLLIFYYFKLYGSIWRYASIAELMRVVGASIAGNALMISILFLMGLNLPRSVYLIVLLLDMAFIGGIRLGLRSINHYFHSEKTDKKTQKRIMIVGGGDAGAMVIKELRNHQSLLSKPVVIVDDDKRKHGQSVNGIPIAGGRDRIPDTAEKYRIDEIIIAIPSASKKDISDIVNICKETGAKLKILPGIYELIDEVVTINSIREVQIEDLLGRDEIRTDMDAVSGYLRDKIVMVTGGGGSIGSELCRQIAIQKPKRLIILDIYENSAYSIQNELKKKYKDLDLMVYIGSIRDKQRVNELLDKERPNVIFHAAAHKHVPLMEDSPKEAIKNNVFGTWNLASAASKNKVSKFVMISTDKAVNPTNIMGASKRLCEMLIQAINKVSETEFVAVRFGNVLGSNGSVIPLFKKQIAEGGPVTVTHEEVIRYFMTIPEAVQLVMQAGAMAEGGEIFILDMGKPVKILDLAEDLIRLSGYEPYTEIPIKIIGLRPGEKLFEELLLDEEGILATKHDKIFVAKPLEIDFGKLETDLEELYQVIWNGSDTAVKAFVQELVPNYKEEKNS
ncbi:nucleoside-diphosphate sugar epimerase/dehydratase [Gudongella oleilytica]|uniref:nucleoside-diphosphate sugar epimerase/dehydratase n=1 Tax=Gudongella oleilytica TaxID=1582259 RepID=UPI002A359FB3|nr:nucleoside-diphosphate sugar epimerase/dehydratase [Gudongella oleilytica]MDY0255869.1 nucleoside-diphosphate sugar epimerase/dehydratase [Gudongella oleilytica]